MNGKKFSELCKFRESDRLMKHVLGSIYVSHICLAGAVVTSWSLTQEVVGSNPFTVMTDILVIEFSEFNENI